MAGNASVYHVYLVSRITGEGRAELGTGSEKEGAGGGGGSSGATQSVRGNYRPFDGDIYTLIFNVE